MDRAEFTASCEVPGYFQLVAGKTLRAARGIARREVSDRAQLESTVAQLEVIASHAEEPAWLRWYRKGDTHPSVVQRLEDGGAELPDGSPAEVSAALVQAVIGSNAVLQQMAAYAVDALLRVQELSLERTWDAGRAVGAMMAAGDPTGGAASSPAAAMLERVIDRVLPAGGGGPVDGAALARYYQALPPESRLGWLDQVASFVEAAAGDQGDTGAPMPPPDAPAGA